MSEIVNVCPVSFFFSNKRNGEVKTRRRNERNKRKNIQITTLFIWTISLFILQIYLAQTNKRPFFPPISSSMRHKFVNSYNFIQVLYLLPLNTKKNFSFYPLLISGYVSIGTLILWQLTKVLQRHMGGMQFYKRGCKNLSCLFFIYVTSKRM